MSQKALYDMMDRIAELEGERTRLREACRWLCDACDSHVKDVDVCVQIAPAYEHARQAIAACEDDVSVLGGEQRPTGAEITPDCPIKQTRGES